MEKNKYSSFNEVANGTNNLFIIIKSYNNEFDNFVSDSAEKITGYTPIEISKFPESVYTLIQEDDSNNVKHSLIEFESNSFLNSLLLMYKITAKNGDTVWLQESINVIRDISDGSITERKSVFVDITPIKTNEEKSKISCQALQELNSQKDKFISIISHDLRSPFTTLLGFSEILLNEPDITEDERNEYLKYIYDASKSQLNLINCLLDWSRLQTGRIKVEPVRLNVKHIISNAVTPLTGDAVRKNIDVKVDIPSDLSINADERLISQVIINLVSNAIKFTHEGKEVNITSKRFKEGFVEIVIKDEGIGISEENQTKLFRIDQKFSLQGTTGEKGSGFGLTLVKEIIEKHGGQVWFYSQLDQGSEFHFTIPEAKNIILFVEDSEEKKVSYSSFISSELPNFEVRFAKNGYEAISLYKDILPSIVVTNHDMPLMNGIQLVEAILNKESNKAVPIIVIANHLAEEKIKKYYKLGVEKILFNPIENSELAFTIKNCLY